MNKQIQLQLAMDGAAEGRTVEQAIEIIKNLRDYVDVIEVGTSFMFRYGVEAIKAIKTQFPEKVILADMKIMDGGGHFSKLGCDYGADIITVLGVSDDKTIKDAITEAHKQNKLVMVDLLRCMDIESRIAQMEELGADYVCVHSGVDMQKEYSSSLLSELDIAVGCAKKAKVAVAGGINVASIQSIVDQKPDLIIVGGGILNQTDYLTPAKEISKVIRGV